MSSIADALRAARDHIPLAEARLLLRHQLGCGAVWLEAHRDESLGEAQLDGFAALVARRAAGEPIAYICGQREFYGRTFAVSEGVLIPRPETELLVDWALVAAKAWTSPRILDLGTGSGCIALTLAFELPHALVTAVDVSCVALNIARDNAARLAAPVRWLESDWFSALTAEHFELIVANPPYIAQNDVHLAQGDLRFEPPTALASGSDGLDAIRRIITEAQAHLVAGGRLMFEHGYDQGEAVCRLLADAGYADIEQQRDLAGIVRISGGRKT